MTIALIVCAVVIVIGAVVALAPLPADDAWEIDAHREAVHGFISDTLADD